MKNDFLLERSIEAAIQETKKLLGSSSCHYQKALEISESIMSYSSLKNTTQMQFNLRRMKTSCLETVRLLIRVLENKDEYTREHCERVTKLCLNIGSALGLSMEEMLQLEFGGLLHDIGKIALPNEIINKEGELTQQEYDIVKLHPVVGSQLIKDITYLAPSRLVLLQHHERMDGKGYPMGLAGDEIDIKARILAVADAYDAMTSSRPYRKAGMTVEEAICELELNKGTQFDKEIVDTFIGLLKSGIVA